MGNAKGGETKQKRGILENIKMRKAKGKETKTEQGIVGSIKMGKPEGKETNQKKEQWKILYKARLRGNRQNRTRNGEKY